ncbi:hypothetical protein ACPUGT_17090 [Klebsiella aerogenes]|uniref:hypothetical protein n=1 Tax=Klebsiella aerogenes TaxID=548 RepID=UPI003D344F53
MNNELTAALLNIEKSKEASGCPAGVDLQDWVKQLAAENVQIKAMNDCLSEELRGYESDGAFDGPKMHLLWWQVETPVTDAYLAGIKADGVEEFAAKLRIPGDDQFFDALAKGVALAADDFAKQLREGADK